MYRAGEIASEMFFVVSGSVDEVMENAEVAICFSFSSCKRMEPIQISLQCQGGDLQHGKVERTVHSGRGTGELSFFFGMRHLG